MIPWDLLPIISIYFQNIFITPRGRVVPIKPSSLHPSYPHPLATPCQPLSPWMTLFWILHVKMYLLVCDFFH